MSVTVVNDYYFKPEGNVAEGKAAAAELLDYFTRHVPAVQLSLWLEVRENPLHHYHITVLDNPDALARLRESEGIKRFVERLFPHIDHSSYVSPLCDVWLAGGRGVSAVEWTR